MSYTSYIDIETKDASGAIQTKRLEVGADLDVVSMQVFRETKKGGTKNDTV